MACLGLSKPSQLWFGSVVTLYRNSSITAKPWKLADKLCGRGLDANRQILVSGPVPVPQTRLETGRGQQKQQKPASKTVHQRLSCILAHSVGATQEKLFFQVWRGQELLGLAGLSILASVSARRCESKTHMKRYCISYTR